MSARNCAFTSSVLGDVCGVLLGTCSKRVGSGSANEDSDEKERSTTGELKEEGRRTVEMARHPEEGEARVVGPNGVRRHANNKLLLRCERRAAPQFNQRRVVVVVARYMTANGMSVCL
jgi:hypothetical protein